jgi:hypothetical protein
MREKKAKLQEWLGLIAGVLSDVLGATMHPAWNYFAAFVAMNLIQSLFHPPAPGAPRYALSRTPDGIR